MAYCSFSGVEEYKNHFEAGKYWGKEGIKALSGGCLKSWSLLLSSEGYMSALNVGMSCSPARPSLSTRLLGLPSPGPFMRTASSKNLKPGDQ